MKESILQSKSLELGIMVARYCTSLKEKRHYEIANQLLRSGTSIGANIYESAAWYSRKDFWFKLQIALKECYETEYRCHLLEQWFDEKVEDIKNLNLECKKLLTSSLNTIKSKD